MWPARDGEEGGGSQMCAPMNHTGGNALAIHLLDEAAETEAAVLAVATDRVLIVNDVEHRGIKPLARRGEDEKFLDLFPVKFEVIPKGGIYVLANVLGRRTHMGVSRDDE